MSLVAEINKIDRQIKVIVRQLSTENLSQAEKKALQQIKLGCNELKLDVRDYEYAETRAEQLKWAKIAQHNLKAVETLVLQNGTIFGPVDVAELSARIEDIRAKLI
ncbi:MAG: hypothetical protein WAQ24_04005 [Candidatus Saccharimonadales bacterium]